jgi:hypothetical protein
MIDAWCGVKQVACNLHKTTYAAYVPHPQERLGVRNTMRPFHSGNAVRRTDHIAHAVPTMNNRVPTMLMRSQLRMLGLLSTASNAASSAATNAGPPCTSVAGVCVPLVPENGSCNNETGVKLPNTEELLQGCPAQQICCVNLAPGGGLPSDLAAAGYINCGGRICPPGSTCVHSTDQTGCEMSDLVDASAD